MTEMGGSMMIESGCYQGDAAAFDLSVARNK
jgi:hypothetical protein